jgi:hypothetical protein
VATGLFATLLLAQEPTPAPAPQTPPQPPPPPVLEYSGKPLAIPFRCTDEDIQFAGLSCSEEDPCPIYLELSAVESVGNRIFAVGNLHSASVTLYGILLASEDAGHTWGEAHERIRGTLLDHIQFLDPAVGWISGHAVSPLPQDPFLLRTTDGGKTWRQRAVFSESAENRLGSIQQFFFADKDGGSLIIDRGQGSDEDRYELYESSDGGESWNIRESSRKVLRLKRAAVPSAEWRLRADAPSKAFHIEHQQGTRWGTVASFLVRVGTCKPEQPVLEPPARKQ